MTVSLRCFATLRVFATLLLAAAVGGCPGGPAEEPEAEASPTAAEVMGEVGRELDRLQLEDNLWLQLSRGVEMTGLPDLGHEYARRRSRAAQALLDRLQAASPEELSHGEWVTFESLHWDLARIAESGRFYWLSFPITPHAFLLLGTHNLFQTFPVETPRDARQYLDLAAQYPAFLGAMRAKLAGQKERGIVLPRAEIDLVVPTWEALPDSPQTVFPYLEEAPQLAGPGIAGEDFQAELASLVESEIRPAWLQLVEFLEGDYRSAAPETVGLSQYPDGAAYYAYLIRLSVTMEVAPQQIHRLGLERTAATGKRMKTVRDELGFSGTRAEFHRRLGSDPRFFAKTPAEVERRLLSFIDAIEPRIDAFFLRTPRAPYRLEQLSPELEAGMTYGYYIDPTATEPSGIYHYNASRLDERSLIGAGSLIYHELIPGHHFQVCLQSENEALPTYHRDSWHDAFGEGWAEYASSLAEEMGMYRDRYDLYGRLAEENQLSSGLVVDTGMNALGWPRRRASEFLREHTLMSDTEIAGETLRYSVDIPAQALSYAFGSHKIRDLREHARRELGDRFDIRRFHAAVLDYGTMPLAVLERHIDWFIEEERR